MYILLVGFPPFSSRTNNQEELFDQAWPLTHFFHIHVTPFTCLRNCRGESVALFGSIQCHQVKKKAGNKMYYSDHTFSQPDPEWTLRIQLSRLGRDLLPGQRADLPHAPGRPAATLLGIRDTPTPMDQSQGVSGHTQRQSIPQMRSKSPKLIQQSFFHLHSLFRKPLATLPKRPPMKLADQIQSAYKFEENWLLLCG